jgi:hypothetical protein
MNGEGFSDGMDPRCSFNLLFIGVMHPPPANLCVMQKLPPIPLHDELASPNSGHLRARHVERGVDHRRRLKLAAGRAKRCREAAGPGGAGGRPASWRCWYRGLPSEEDGFADVRKFG